MSATKIKIGILAATVAVVGLVIQNVHQRNRMSALRQDLLAQQSEHQRLTTRLQPTANSPATENTATRMNILLSRLAARRAGAATPNSDTTDSRKTEMKRGMKAVGSLGNAGQATPFTALESSIWARYNGDVEALARMVTFTPDGRDKATKLWTTLPANIQAQFPTPEQFVALFLVDGFPPNITGYAVTGDQQNGPTPNDWLVQIQYQRSDGTTLDSAAALEQISGNWMLLLGANGIQKLATSLGAGGPL